MATYLDSILAEHRAAAAHDTRSLERLVTSARSQPATRGFRRALVAASG